MHEVNLMLKPQEGSACTFSVEGADHWMDVLLTERVRLNEAWARVCGGDDVPLLTYMLKEAQTQGYGRERAVVKTFLNNAYCFKELEVEIRGQEDWGRCVWYPRHPAYAKSIPKFFAGSRLDDPSLFYAMFRTDTGDQHFNFYSMDMIADCLVLPAPAFVYLKVVFAPSEQRKRIAL